MDGKPLVLVSPSTEKKGVEFADISLNLSEAYLRTVIAAGGVPCVPSCTADPEYIAAIVARAEGVLLTGGDDVQPSLYAGDLPPGLRATSTRHDPERDRFELLLVAEVFRARKPLLAICRGHQLLNVAFGGTLYVDIALQRPDALPHQRLDRKNYPVHEVRLASGSLIASLFPKSTCDVNSTHHQAVERLAEPFQATALSPDGIIEAMELRAGCAQPLPWFLSVQFHPERLWLKHPEFLAPFREFVRACSAN